VRDAVAVAREWAGEGFVALLLSGSHATGEAVWFEIGGRRLTVSDVDLYAVLRDAGACRAAAARARAEGAAAAARLRASGLEAPLEVGFVTPDGLARMPARPGTIELARHGVVVAGEAAMLGRVPRWSPREVSGEEVALLLENRGFELLFAWPSLAAEDVLARVRARHATLKAVADLATVLALRAGELPDGTASRLAWARERAEGLLGPALPTDLSGVPAGMEALWTACLAWRRGEAGLPPAGEGTEEWRRSVRAWCAVWWWLFDRAGREPWSRARQVAARAPLRRRLRRGLFAPGPASLADRARRMLAGTPQHRVNGSAAILLLSAAAAAGTPVLSPSALRTLRALGVTRATTWAEARAEVMRAWDRIVLGGRRGTETP
jgi:hypothetical protein